MIATALSQDPARDGRKKGGPNGPPFRVLRETGVATRRRPAYIDFVVM